MTPADIPPIIRCISRSHELRHRSSMTHCSARSELPTECRPSSNEAVKIVVN